MIEIIPARASHVRRVASVLRDADRQEVEAFTGRSPLAALSMSFRRSMWCWTVMIDGKPEAMLGLGAVNILGSVGSPWLVGSDAITADRVLFARRSIEWRDAWLSKFSTLRNFIDCRNRASIEWLRWLGATFSPPVVIGGKNFMIFEMRATDVR